MKKLLLILSVLIVYTNGYTQSCATVNPSSGITKIANGLYKLQVNFTGNGQKHLNIKFYEGVVLPINLLSTTCLPIHGSGTEEVNFISLGNNPKAVIIPGNGNCGGGGECPQNAVTITYTAPFVLPVVLKSFDVMQRDNKAHLSWITASEQNVKEFVIQRNEGGIYTDIRTIAAKNAAAGSSYTYVDVISSGSFQYRLKMVDIDGKFTFSPVRLIKTEIKELLVYPNPAPAGIPINVLNTTSSDIIVLFDHTGKLVLKQSGSTITAILQPGSYQVQISKSSGSIIRKKLLVMPYQ